VRAPVQGRLFHVGGGGTLESGKQKQEGGGGLTKSIPFIARFFAARVGYLSWADLNSKKKSQTNLSGGVEGGGKVPDSDRGTGRGGGGEGGWGHQK